MIVLGRVMPFGGWRFSCNAGHQGARGPVAGSIVGTGEYSGIDTRVVLSGIRGRT
jgi:hypothetical protein